MADDTSCLLCDWTGAYEEYAAHRHEAHGGPIPAPNGVEGVILLAVRNGEIRFTASGVGRRDAIAILSGMAARLSFPELDGTKAVSVGLEVDPTAESVTPPDPEATPDA